MATNYRAWQPSLDVTINSFMEPTTAPLFGFEATTAGRTGLTEPAWPTVAGGTVVDGTVTWTARTAQTITWRCFPLYQTAGNEPGTGGEPAWSTVLGGFTDNGTAPNGVRFVTRTPAITDAKAPDSKIAIAMAQKIFSPYNEVMRYCATNNPRDWSSEDDAGFLPVGLQAPVSPEVTAVGEFRGRMAIFTASDLQIWTVDPDPQEMSLFDTIAGIGSAYSDGSASVAGDLYFMTNMGVRTLSVAAGSTNLQAGDIGTGVDELVVDRLQTYFPRAFYYPGSGQFWLQFNNEIFVFSQSRLGKVGAWSRYLLGLAAPSASTQLNGDLYLRIGDIMYRVQEGYLLDDALTYTCTIQWPYMDMGSPGVTKMLHSVDLTGYGTGTLSIGYDQVTGTDFTADVAIGPDTVVGGRIPIPIAAPSFSVKMVYSTAGPQPEIQLNSLDMIFEDFKLGMGP